MAKSEAYSPGRESIRTRELRVLVTGASGFLGSEIVRQLDQAGIHVHALARSWGREPLWSDNVKCIAGDITDAGSLSNAFDGISVVIHSAGLAHQFGRSSTRAADFQKINVDGTRILLQAAIESGVTQTILVSSVSVYGGGQQPRHENSPCHPVEPYGISKFEAEQAAVAIAARSEMRLTILRMATIFGEGDPGNVGRLMKTIDRGRFIWLGTGQNVKSLIYRDDAARACILAAMMPPRDTSRLPRTYNVTMPPVPMLKVVDALANGLGRRTPRWYIPAKIAKAAGRSLRAIIRHRAASKIDQTISKWLSDDIYVGTRFEEDFRFSPGTTVEEGLCREAKWYRQHKAA